MQTTLIILKPDALQRGLAGRIISRFEDKGMQIVGARLIRISAELAARHYHVHRDKPFYDGLVRFMTSAPVLVMAIRGHHAIDTTRKLLGATKGYEADAGTIRGDFGASRSFNLVHASDGPDTAEYELGLFFRPEELCPYDRAIEPWVVDMSSGSPE